MKLSKQYAFRLLSVSSAKELEVLLTTVFGQAVLSSPQFWNPVGDQKSNAGAIQASADPVNPLVERVINGMEAVLELELAKRRLSDPELPDPQSAGNAVENLMSIPGGDIRALSDADARSLAERVEMSFLGDKYVPTVAIRDYGIGVSPRELKETILSLGQSEKGKKPYLIGMYGQGGSSTYDKCRYTVIFSRLNPALASSASESAIGWTVVRKRLETRSYIYEYLVLPGTARVPEISGDWAPAMDMDSGTKILHIDYAEIGQMASQRLTNYAYYTFNFRLFDPPLPWKLSDLRRTPTESRTMRGIPYRLDRLPRTDSIGLLPNRSKSDENASIRHHQRLKYQINDTESILVEWWVLQDDKNPDQGQRRKHTQKIDPYRDRTKRFYQRKVAVTRVGQINAALTLHQFTRNRFRLVANSTIVHISTDGLSFETLAGFFQSNRADLSDGSLEIIENAIAAAIESSKDSLREIERERGDEIFRGQGASDENQVRSHLDPMIKEFAREVGGQSGSGLDRPRQKPGQPRLRRMPTYIEFARRKPLDLIPGKFSSAILRTDASDSVISNKNTRLDFILEPSDEQVSATLASARDGRWRINLYVKPDSVIGSISKFRVVLERKGVFRLETPHSLDLKIVNPPPPFKGVDPPTLIQFKNNESGEVHVRQGGAIVALKTDAKDNLALQGFTVNPPDGISFKSVQSPSRGEIKVLLEVPIDAELGSAGQIEAIWPLQSGISLTSRAILIVDQRRSRAGAVRPELQPNYEIRDVRQIPLREGELSWEAVPDLLHGEDPWNGDDVGAYYLSNGNNGDIESRKLVFLINVDNKNLLNSVQNALNRIGEGRVESLRTFHKALLCYHLYQIALSPILAASRDEDEILNEKGPMIEDSGLHDHDYMNYRTEMIRLNVSSLWADREFRVQDDSQVAAEQ